MKKQSLLFFLLLCIGGQIWGQENSSDSVEKILDSIIDKKISEIRKDSILISNAAFYKVVKNDFSKVQTAYKFDNVTNRYASLNINGENQTFSFAPYNWTSFSGHHYIGLNLDGVLNGKNIFDFKDRHQVSTGINYTYLRALKKFKSNDSSTYLKFINEAKKKILKDRSQEKIGDLIFQKDTIEYKKRDELEKEFIEKIENYEIEYAKKYWASKSLFWISFNVTPFNYDSFKYLIEGDVESYEKPYKKTLNVFKVSTSLNYYYENKHFVVSPSLSFLASNKHNLSEIYSSKQWNKIAELTNQIYLSEESANVYRLENNNFYQSFLLDVSFRCIVISQKYRLGTEFIFGNSNFITPGTTNGISKINDFSIGIILPFKDKEGNSTINLTPFYYFKQFINYEQASSSHLGVKFNIPLSH